MGQQQTRGNQSVHKISHSKFDKIKLPYNPCDKTSEIMIIQFPCEQTTYEQWKNNLQKKQNQLKNSQYLFLPINHQYSSAGLCGRVGSVKVTYYRFPYVLQDQILSAQRKKSTFSEPQMWQLLWSIIKAKRQWCNISGANFTNLGKINPKNILLNEKSQIKIANPLSQPNYINGYKSAILRQVSYLSPEDIQRLELGASNNDQNRHSEMYSIGMTLLSVGLTQNLECIYDLDKNEIKKDLFQQKIMLWKTTLYYSQILRALVISLLEWNPDKRISFEQLQIFLEPHSQNIHLQKPLVIKNANTKLHSIVDLLRSQLPSLAHKRFDKKSQPPRNYTQINQLKSKIIKNDIPTYNSVIDRTNSNSIGRVKSKTRFVYSNKVIQQNNGMIVNKITNNMAKDAPKMKNQQKSPEVVNQSVNQAGRIQYPYDSPEAIAKRLLQQSNGQIKHTDSQINISPNQKVLSSQNQKHIQTLQNEYVNPEVRMAFQKNENFNYHTYKQIVVNSDFEIVWQNFIHLIKKPQFYFPEFKDKIMVTDQPIEEKLVIEIPPGRVRLDLNKEEGKVRLQNLSESCYGDILGGVSKVSQSKVQIWFNSSYTLSNRPFPQNQFFQKGLEKLKNILQPKEA